VVFHEVKETVRSVA